MAAGEFVSVSSQYDSEVADLKREQKELETIPDIELKELSKLYEKRGLDKDLAMQVASQLTKRDALEAHGRDELGINEFTKPKPLQAALASGASFITGGMLPLLISIFSPIKSMVIYQYSFAIVFLALSGAVAAKVDGSNIQKSILRIAAVWSRPTAPKLRTIISLATDFKLNLALVPANKQISAFCIYLHFGFFIR